MKNINIESQKARVEEINSSKYSSFRKDDYSIKLNMLSSQERVALLDARNRRDYAGDINLFAELDTDNTIFFTQDEPE